MSSVKGRNNYGADFVVSMAPKSQRGSASQHANWYSLNQVDVTLKRAGGVSERRFRPITAKLFTEAIHAVPHAEDRRVRTSRYPCKWIEGANKETIRYLHLNTL